MENQYTPMGGETELLQPQPEQQPQYQQPQYQQPQYQQPQYQQPQYQQPQYQQPQYQQPQYQQPQYQQPQYQQPVYQQPQYTVAPKVEETTVLGKIMSIVGFACSMVSILFMIIGFASIEEYWYYTYYGTANDMGMVVTMLSISGIVCSILGIAKRGKKGLALPGIIVGGIMFVLGLVLASL